MKIKTIQQLVLGARVSDKNTFWITIDWDCILGTHKMF